MAPATAVPHVLYPSVLCPSVVRVLVARSFPLLLALKLVRPMPFRESTRLAGADEGTKSWEARSILDLRAEEPGADQLSLLRREGLENAFNLGQRDVPSLCENHRRVGVIATWKTTGSGLASVVLATPTNTLVLLPLVPRIKIVSPMPLGKTTLPTRTQEALEGASTRATWVTTKATHRERTVLPRQHIQHTAHVAPVKLPPSTESGHVSVHAQTRLITMSGLFQLLLRNVVQTGINKIRSTEVARWATLVFPVGRDRCTAARSGETHNSFSGICVGCRDA
mmetsp:Transcript_55932/g.149168  ORF Transcript_55932/g.149168 Transcript_55932/m.149168 type:complete len:281 (-) Transcript_55932:112-954(-)